MIKRTLWEGDNESFETKLKDGMFGASTCFFYNSIGIIKVNNNGIKSWVGLPKCLLKNWIQ